MTVSGVETVAVSCKILFLHCLGWRRKPQKD